MDSDLECYHLLNLRTQSNGIVKVQAPPAYPRTFAWFWIAALVVLAFQLVVLRRIPGVNEKHWIRTIMIIVAVSTVALASGSLILASFFLLSWMECTVFCVIFAGLLYHFNSYPVHCSFFLRSQKVEATPANPQSFAYFSFLFADMGVITFLLGALRLSLQRNPYLFEDHWIFTIMIIVSGSMVVLASGILILARLLLLSWMQDIHHTIVKTIGSFSAIVLSFSLGAAVFVPSGDLNWIACTVLCVIFAGLLYLYSFIWKVACAYHQEEHFNSYPVHWAFLLIILVPLSISLLSLLSPNQWWLATIFVSFSIIVPSFIALMRFNREAKVCNSEHLQQDKTIDQP